MHWIVTLVVCRQTVLHTRSRKSKTPITTSNVTIVTEVRSASARLFPVRGAPGECYYNTLLCCEYFSSSSVVSRTFSVLCVYSTFGHHPHHLDYLCVKLHFFCGLHCWYSPWRKIAYSINHLPSLFDALGTEVLALWKMCCVSVV